jgi:hypothetical protein
MSKANPLIVGIDPGNTDSAIVLWDPIAKFIMGKEYARNADVFKTLSAFIDNSNVAPRLVAIEQIRSYGMAVGATVFDTVHWSGRFHQYILDHYTDDKATVILVPRRDVKMHICHSNKAKDTNINTAIADMFGGIKVAKGTKKEPGPLYGVSGDIWAALALAITVGANLRDGVYVPGMAGTLPLD